MKRLLLYPALVLIALAGCGGYQDKDSGELPVQQSPAAPPGDPGRSIPPNASGTPENGSPGDGSATPTPVERKLIRNGTIELRVESVAATEAALATLVATNKGYISNSNRSRSSGNTLVATARLRFPSGQFDTVLAAVRGLGKVENETLRSSDVTEDYIDLSARLKTQQDLEARLLKLLQDRGGKLSDIIEIEAKLAQVRTEIESVQGRLRYLENQVAYSTLEVSMAEPGALGTSSTETVGGKIGGAFSSGFESLVGMIAGLITFILGILPLAAFLLVIYIFIVRPLARRRRERQAAQPPLRPGAPRQPTAGTPSTQQDEIT